MVSASSGDAKSTTQQKPKERYEKNNRLGKTELKKAIAGLVAGEMATMD